MIRLYYYDIGNFGDSLSYDLCALLAKKRILKETLDGANLFAVGSILGDGGCIACKKGEGAFRGVLRYMRALKHRILCPTLHIWGTGFLLEPTWVNKIYQRRRIVFHAVRGRRTLDILNKYFSWCKNDSIALGDPGLLYVKLIEDEEGEYNKYDLGVILHYADRDNYNEKLEQHFSKIGYNALFINVMTKNPVQILRDIRKCRVILSSSLHGCIVADSMRIPNKHLMLSTFGWSFKDFIFKYQDYYSIFDMDYMPKFLLNDVDSLGVKLIDYIEKTYSIPYEIVEKTQKTLLETFPREIL